MSKLASTLYAQGDLEGARGLQVQVLEASRRLLGQEHPDTSSSAWNLYSTLRALGEDEEATAVVRERLSWLLDRDPATLGRDHRQIRQLLLEIQNSQSASAENRSGGTLGVNFVTGPGRGGFAK